MPCRNFENVVDRRNRTLDRWIAGLSAGGLAVLGGVVAAVYWRHR